ncbi:hypothetical protein VTL71DRAFT_6821 [Oculimacula yallundae]|uniref:Uncharacterized protein n=1 Tax=Oculimacula yallundae TaxID=86028 RepID=A0ABR4BY67_9HELO
MVRYESSLANAGSWTNRDVNGIDQNLLTAKRECINLGLAHFFAEQKLPRAEAMGKIPSSMVSAARGVATAQVKTFTDAIKNACDSVKSEFGQRTRALLADMLISDLFLEAVQLSQSARMKWFRGNLSWMPRDEEEDAANPLKSRKVLVMLFAPFKYAVDLRFIIGYAMLNLPPETLEIKRKAIQYTVTNNGNLTRGRIEFFKLPTNRNFKDYKVSVNDITIKHNIAGSRERTPMAENNFEVDIMTR